MLRERRGRSGEAAYEAPDPFPYDRGGRRRGRSVAHRRGCRRPSRACPWCAMRSCTATSAATTSASSAIARCSSTGAPRCAVILTTTSRPRSACSCPREVRTRSTSCPKGVRGPPTTPAGTCDAPTATPRLRNGSACPQTDLYDLPELDCALPRPPRLETAPAAPETPPLVRVVPVPTSAHRIAVGGTVYRQMSGIMGPSSGDRLYRTSFGFSGVNPCTRTARE
jgi:hypothetical protein